MRNNYINLFYKIYVRCFQTVFKLAILTTCGIGSETTLAAVITDSKTRHKYAINDFLLIPSYAASDWKLLLNLHSHLISTIGLNLPMRYQRYKDLY